MDKICLALSMLGFSGQAPIAVPLLKTCLTVKIPVFPVQDICSLQQFLQQSQSSSPKQHFHHPPPKKITTLLKPLAERFYLQEASINSQLSIMNYPFSNWLIILRYSAPKSRSCGGRCCRRWRSHCRRAGPRRCHCCWNALYWPSSSRSRHG